MTDPKRTPPALIIADQPTALVVEAAATDERCGEPESGGTACGEQARFTIVVSRLAECPQRLPTCPKHANGAADRLAAGLAARRNRQAN